VKGGALEKGFDYAMEAAADAATIFAYADSIRLYEQARECAEVLNRDDELPRIDTALGDVYTLKGEPLPAAEHFERALAVTDDAAENVRLQCKIGEAYVLIGDARALTYVDRAKTALDPETQPIEFASATMIEARSHHYDGRSRKAAELFHQIVGPVERSGETLLLGWIYGYLAGAYQHLCEFDTSNGWAQRAIDLGRERNNPAIESIGVEFRMENSFTRGHWRECLEHAARHRELGEKACSSDRLAWNHLGFASAKLGLGELEAAETSFKGGIELAERLGDKRLAIFLGNWYAHALVDLGRIDEAIELTDPLIEQADALGLKAGQGVSRQGRAYAALHAGDHSNVIKLAGQAEALLEGSDEAVNPIWMSPTIIASLVATGKLDEADRRLRTILEATRKAGMPHWEGMALKVRGLLNRALADHRAASTDFDAAIVIFEELGSRLELGRTLVLRGGDTDLDRARGLFAACGAAGELAKLSS
jgi:tetratricopeptide (TPR) repeat protein